MTNVYRWARIAIWGLPAYALLTLIATISHQPDPVTRFDAWSRYVTTNWFLVSHIFGSIGGVAVGIVGTVGLLVLLAGTPAARTAAWGALMTIFGSCLTLALFGVAAFAQPVIGRVHLAGFQGAAGLYLATYGTPTVLVALAGVLLMSAGPVLLGIAIVRARTLPRWTGVLYALSGPLIGFLGLLVGAAQPIGSILLLASAVNIARGARHRNEDIERASPAGRARGAAA